MANVGGSGFNVDLGKLSETHQYVQSLVPQIQKGMATMDGAMQQMMQSWAGNKAGKFQQMYAVWQQNHKQMHLALSNIGDLLGQTHVAYSQSDEA